MEPTHVTSALVVFGVITMGPLTYVYLVFLRSPHSSKSKDLMIGKDKDWRDKTHFRLNLGFAWADLLFFVPLFVSGCVGVLLGQTWGYVLFGAAGCSTLYINIILWFTEKEHVYAALGPLRYFTYFWGFFVYWGALALVYSALRIGGVEF
ncbi:MAG: hypothetical protein JSV52_07570 [Candidatus Zixiibacteriota bacterium]|nr:MAG: hypothetical protein JSV52_07570 [candidate division Zixibacteria bacterium]